MLFPPPTKPILYLPIKILSIPVPSNLSLIAPQLMLLLYGHTVMVVSGKTGGRRCVV